jgi:hypothetical protein
MIISKGREDKILGASAPDDDGNYLAILNLVEKFSEETCAALRRKPKLFFFNICIESIFLDPNNFRKY